MTKDPNQPHIPHNSVHINGRFNPRALPRAYGSVHSLHEPSLECRNVTISRGGRAAHPRAAGWDAQTRASSEWLTCSGHTEERWGRSISAAGCSSRLGPILKVGAGESCCPMAVRKRPDLTQYSELWDPNCLKTVKGAHSVLLLSLNIMHACGFWSICHVYIAQKPLKIGRFIYRT